MLVEEWFYIPQKVDEWILRNEKGGEEQLSVNGCYRVGG